MDQNDQIEQVAPNGVRFPLPPYASEQYIEHIKRLEKELAKLRKYEDKYRKIETDLQLIRQENNHLKREVDAYKEASAPLEKRLEDSIRAEKNLELKEQEINHLKEKTLTITVVQHILQIITSISLGMGINFATSTLLNLAGWPLICFAVIIQTASFLITYINTEKNIFVTRKKTNGQI